MPDLLFEKRDGVAWITFNRPESKNAISPEAFCRLADAWTEVRDDDEVRVAVLTGAGNDTFTAGGDLKLAGMVGDVFEVFQLLEFQSILEAYETIDEAKEAFKKGGSGRADS